MAVVADAEELQIDAAQGFDQPVVPAALQGRREAGAVGQVGIFPRNIDEGEEILLHKIAVAHFVIGGKAVILVQIDGGHVPEGDLTGPAQPGQFRIHPHGGGSGGKAQNGAGIFPHLIGHNRGGAAAHTFVIGIHTDTHDGVSFVCQKM